MSKMNPIGLDDQITINDELTTIRKEHQSGHVRAMRGSNGQILGKDTFGHWALIEGISFPISASDFALLLGIN